MKRSPLQERDEESGVFPTISRLNHACVPNCHHEWNAELGGATIQVIAEVRAGEELTICYLMPSGAPPAWTKGVARARTADCTRAHGAWHMAPVHLHAVHGH